MPTCEALPTPLMCQVSVNAAFEGALPAENKRAMCDLGLREQDVVIVTSMPTPTFGSFTDIGHSATGQAPVHTVTLYKQSAARKRSFSKGVVLLAVGAMFVFGMG
jgi:hypothetical protein